MTNAAKNSINHLIREDSRSCYLRKGVRLNVSMSSENNASFGKDSKPISGFGDNAVQSADEVTSSEEEEREFLSDVLLGLGEEGEKKVLVSLAEIKVLSKLSELRLTLNSFDRPIFILEMTTYPDLPQHLNGSGLAIINPPWQFAETAETLLPWLWNALTINGQGYYRAEHLK